MSPAWRRAHVTALVLAERRWLCGELAARGIAASMLIVADDENLEVAAEFGAATVETPNLPLGRKCNVGLAAAAARADFVVWVGSDDWIHPDTFDPLLELEPGGAPQLIVGRTNAVLDMERGCLQRISSPSKFGAIPWILDSRVFRARSPGGPIQEDLRHGLDGALIRGLRRNRVPFGWVWHDPPHGLRCVDFKTSLNITPYWRPAKHLAIGPEIPDPWETLAGHYPADLVERARALTEGTDG